MNTKFMTATIAALILGGPMVGCAANGGGVVAASDRAGTLAQKSAARDAGRAQTALARHQDMQAVGFAESAVALMPQSAEYRQLLAQSYLQAGRFTSAAQAYADVLALSPNNRKAALNLALAEIATGDRQTARATLATYQTIIPAGDRGLAMSLAGDTAGGIALLTELARSSESTVKIRQNLALSFALAGQWPSARIVAAADMAPADVDSRLEQWAMFAQPATASDQVAGLLGVRAVRDDGRPLALALNAQAPVEPDSASVLMAAADPVSVPDLIAAPAALASSGFAKVTFGPRREVVQPVPMMLLRQASATKAAATQRGSALVFEPRKSAGGTWFVQLGAFENARVAKDAWDRATRRFARFAGHSPNGMTFRTKGNEFYRLSVGGFSRSDADSVCRQYRAKGGDCFVRTGAGDQMAQWLRAPGIQLAAR
jgi:Flp pilus assembly protein TadD